MKKVKKKVKRKVKRVTKQPTIAEIAEAELRDGGTLDSTAGTVKDGPREESATPKPKRKVEFQSKSNISREPGKTKHRLPPLPSWTSPLCGARLQSSFLAIPPRELQW